LTSLLRYSQDSFSAKGNQLQTAKTTIGKVNEEDQQRQQWMF